MVRIPKLAAAALVVTAASSGPHSVTRTTAALEFAYSWPAEAVAVPPLDTKFYNEAKALLATAQKNSRADQRVSGRDYHRHFSSTKWMTAGQTPRLLSLRGGFEEFTGGAHPNHGSRALLWDRKLRKQVTFGVLFRPNSGYLTAIRGPYCRILDAERAKRRQGQKIGGEFDKCPPFADLALVPMDVNRNGRFERLTIIASPYTAGPYVEGEYAINLPIRASWAATLKPEYRASFEPQPQ